MNTIRKYRPTTLNDFVFPNEKVKREIYRYVDGKTSLPLVLHGPYGTGKSTLAELIPIAIDGPEVQVRRVKAEDLNNAASVRDELSRPEGYDRLFSYGNQRRGYTIIEEVNFDPKAKGAVRVSMDDMSDREQYIFTTNEVEKIDKGILSRSMVLEVPAATPEVFFPKARQIMDAEGVDISDHSLTQVLQSSYAKKPDNREYYSAIDPIIEAHHDKPAKRSA